MIVRSILCFAIICASCIVPLHAQRSTGSGHEYIPEDSLEVQHVFWIGPTVSGMVSLYFGGLTAKYAGGSAPGSTAQTATTEGGYGAAGGGGGAFEFRPFGDVWSVFAMVCADYRYTSSTTGSKISNDIFAINAEFEIITKSWYLTVSPSVRYMFGRTGAFVYGGLDFEIPVGEQYSGVWQHEYPTGDSVGTEPGAPQTNILFKTTLDLVPRVGIHVGLGHDFLAGLFGYRRQMLTPWFQLSAGTAPVSGASWNGIGMRFGIMWRYGF
ncbi:MAG: hypothetical protein JSS89_06845 [Bacteroidetes bacterium]|nr:hypothetical protein [Bacteroidota bacterium]